MPDPPTIHDCPRWRLIRLQLEDRPVRTGWDVNPDERVGAILIILRKPFSYFGRAHANDWIITGFIIRAPAEYLGTDDALSEHIACSGKRAFNDVGEKDLALPATPERRALKDVGQDLPDLSGLVQRNMRTATLC
jgi:hypothetical protein